MKAFEAYLMHVEDSQHKARLEEIFSWIALEFPDLTPKLAWNHPMFTAHGTFIIGFSIAKQHLAVAPEKVVIEHFAEEILQAGYTYSQQLMRIPWTSPVNFSLLQKIIEYNLAAKADCKTFWRK